MPARRAAAQPITVISATHRRPARLLMSLAILLQRVNVVEVKNAHRSITAHKKRRTRAFRPRDRTAEFRGACAAEISPTKHKRALARRLERLHRSSAHTRSFTAATDGN